MSDSELLRILREETVAAASAAKRHIVHFRTKSAYSRFIQLFESAKQTLPRPNAVQPLPIIQAISCTLKSCAELSAHPSIRFIEEDTRIQVHSSHARYMKLSVALHQDAPSVPWGVKQIRAPEAWRESRGRRIRIGVIDTGIDYLHPDLSGRISRGINLLHRGLLPADDNGHGTHISGTIAASNQQSGLVGVAPLAMIHPVKAFDQNGTAYVSDIVLGIDWCVRNRMHIINMSFGMKNRSKSLHDAVRNAYGQGIVVVASSGNDAKRNFIDYPARFAQVISVGATTRNKKLAPFSNRGKSIDIYAPGDKIRSAWLHSSYMELSGTSMATSHVTGVIALMLAARPDLKPKEIRALLRKTSNPIGGLRSNEKVRSGEVDAVRALRYALLKK